MPKDKVIQAAYCHITKEKKEISWLSPFWGNGRKTRHNLSCSWKSIYTTFNYNTILYPATCKHIKLGAKKEHMNRYREEC